MCYFIVMKVLCCSTVSREWLCTPESVSGDGNGSSRGHLAPFSLYLLGDHFSLYLLGDHFSLYLRG